MTVEITDTRSYPPGVPCWVDTEQPDLHLAAHFYGSLFGWAFADAMPPDTPGSYLIATLDGHDVAAIGPAEPGTAATWNTYVACADADAAVAAVHSAGGRVLIAPWDAGPGGRAAVCADPQGAVFRLWQARRRLGAQLVNAPDSWNFSDLHTPDPSQVLPFYASVFDWQVDAGLGAGMVRLPGYGDHLAATVDPDIHERQAFAPEGFADVVAGLSVTDEAPGWQIRFTVADRDASAATAERLGASVASSTETMWTRDAVIRDPQGALLTLSQFAPPE
jgi:uncharacterized protein